MAKTRADAARTDFGRKWLEAMVTTGPESQAKRNRYWLVSFLAGGHIIAAISMFALLNFISVLLVLMTLAALILVVLVGAFVAFIQRPRSWRPWITPSVAAVGLAAAYWIAPVTGSWIKDTRFRWQLGQYTRVVDGLRNEVITYRCHPCVAAKRDLPPGVGRAWTISCGDENMVVMFVLTGVPLVHEAYVYRSSEGDGACEIGGGHWRYVRHVVGHWYHISDQPGL
jgi:uncharacterized membrane protein YhaH (DUF805 family)